jgi:hypothetical protein
MDRMHGNAEGEKTDNKHQLQRDHPSPPVHARRDGSRYEH